MAQITTFCFSSCTTAWKRCWRSCLKETAWRKKERQGNNPPTGRHLSKQAILTAAETSLALCPVTEKASHCYQLHQSANLSPLSPPSKVLLLPPTRRARITSLNGGFWWLITKHMSWILERFKNFFFHNFFNFLAMPHGMWDLNSLTRDQTCTPCIGSAVLTTGLPGKYLEVLLNIKTFL